MIRIGSQAGFRTWVPAQGIGIVLCLFFFLLIALGACKKKVAFLQDDVQFFKQQLTPDMDYDDIVEAFGSPPVDLNAANAEVDGLHIYQYPLMDSMFIRIGFTNKIEYACTADQRNNLVEDVLVVQRDGD